MAGTGVYWARGEDELRALAEALGIPVFLNGMGRGCLPADHELCFSRARGKGLKEADVALVIGVPLDFRLGFGGSFGEETKLIWLDEAPNELTANRRPETRAGRRDRRDAGGDARGGGAGRARGAGGADATAAWVGRCSETEAEKRAAEQDELNDDRAPLHPLRIYKELDEMLDRDAIVIGDGGDFVSYAGRVINTYEPGCWMDPGPYGCLGAGPGQAIGAKTAHPDRQVVCLLGDGAFGFSGLEFDTMARHNLPVVGIIGNNGIWALEYHPMKFLYGYQVAAELRPATRYDEVVQALGGHGELVRHPSRAAAGARARVRERQAGAGERADGSRGGVSAQGRAGLALQRTVICDTSQASTSATLAGDSVVVTDQIGPSARISGSISARSERTSAIAAARSCRGLSARVRNRSITTGFRSGQQHAEVKWKPCPVLRAAGKEQESRATG